MNIEFAREFLGWCALLNVGLICFWFLFFWLGHDVMYRYHSKLFQVSVETFDAIHYAGLAAFKMGVMLLNLVPYLALSIVP